MCDYHKTVKLNFKRTSEQGHIAQRRGSFVLVRERGRGNGKYNFDQNIPKRLVIMEWHLQINCEKSIANVL